MNEKIGRNDLCSCGSGKKYKQCCLNKQKPGQPRKFTAKVLSAKPATPAEGASQSHPVGPDLIARAFSPVLEKQKPDSQ